MGVTIIPRAEWGAVKPKRRTTLDPKRLDGVAVHWFGSPVAAKSHDQCPALLRSVQQGHLNNTKENYSDIAYNHAVCPHGSAYELRGFGVQTGANGFEAANRSHASVVYMAGKGDHFPEAAQQTLAAVILEWQRRGAGLDVKPHGHFTGSECPGHDVGAWLPQKLWALQEKKAPVQDETPEWLMDFVSWRLADDSDPKKRPANLPKRVPASAWETASQIHKVANLMGPQQPFLDWAEWRRQGAKKADRPRSLPAQIPKPWWEALVRLEKIFKGVKTAKPVTPKPPVVPKPVTPKPVTPKQPEPQPDTAPVTVQSTLLAAPRATQKTLERYLLSRQHGSYTDAEVRDIVKKYVTTSKAAGLDPLLVVSQMTLETGNLMSHWSQPPRRNPAGIGVTGQPGAGLSFSNWDKAVRAHVGRLLAYALPKDAGTPAQLALIAEALKVRPLPDDRRGRAPTLKGLAGSWAADTKYADKITRIANEIRRPA